ncbi:MAG: rhomboid family intramembrane serine protease [Rhodobacteraceae bacterium]|nr:rhomboid family intramembrane serine protease [Paracoccaceae bacterium]
MEPDRNAPPLNPLPWVVWLIVLPMIAMEVVVSLGAAGIAGGPTAIGWRSEAVQKLAFSPDMMRAMIAAHQYPLDGMWRLVSYPFIHSALSDALLVVVILMALGKFVGEVFRWWGVLVVLLAATLTGPLVFTALPFVKTPLIGAWVPVYGLIGAMSWILFRRLANEGSKRWRAFSMIGSLLVIQVLFGTIFGFGWHWAAELPAFAVGFGLSYLVAPGEVARLRAMMRQR